MTYRDYDPMLGVGYFDVWLDGMTLNSPASGSFAASVFRLFYDGAPGTFVVRQSGGGPAGAAGNGLRWEQTSAGTGSTYRLVEARIEDATTFNNGPATLSFYITAGQDGTPVQVEVTQFFGSGGNPNGPGGNASPEVVVFRDWIVAGQTPKLTTLTFSVPSTAGKYFGVNWDDCVKIRLKYPAASTFDITLQEFRFERGEERTPFSHVPLCLKASYLDRYIQYHSLSLGSVASGSDQYLYHPIPFRATMRRVPTPTWTGSQRTNIISGPVAGYLKNFGGTAYIRSAAAGPFFALDEYLKLDARL